MKITREEARRIADLAHLEFDEPSLDRLASDMTAILGYVEQINTVTESESVGLESAATPFREDEVTDSLDRSVVEANAPEWSDGFFVVPKVIG